jgi:hypothetical protein
MHWLSIARGIIFVHALLAQARRVQMAAHGSAVAHIDRLYMSQSKRSLRAIASLLPHGTLLRVERRN